MVATRRTLKFAIPEQPKLDPAVNLKLETEMPVTPHSNAKRFSSAKFKPTLLHDWLLGKAKGRRFDVGGDASMDNVGIGASNSANHTPKTPGLDPGPNLTGQTPVTPGSNTKAISSSKLKSILLHDWWLMKAQGKGLAVGGVTSMERERVFFSAMIIKRHVTNVFETKDGIKINVSGFINRSRTRENGFPAEVCDRFEFGFPYDWEKYTTYCCEVENINDATMKATKCQYKEDVTGHKTSHSKVQQMHDGENGISDIPVGKQDENLLVCYPSIPNTCDDLPEKNTDQSPLSTSKEKEYLSGVNEEKNQKYTKCKIPEDCSRRVTRSMSKMNCTSQSQVQEMHNGENAISDVPVRKQNENLPSRRLFVEDVDTLNTCDDLLGINTDQSPFPASNETKEKKDYLSGVSKEKKGKYTKHKMKKKTEISIDQSPFPASKEKRDYLSRVSKEKKGKYTKCKF